MTPVRRLGVCLCGLKSAIHTPRVWNSTKLSVSEMKTAGVIIIGDEILKGQVLDTNSHFITKHLFNIGVKVSRVSIISDNVNSISTEVDSFSKQFTYVITTGGIGPTHDDVTFEGVAKAFDERIAPHPELVNLVNSIFKTDDLNSPAMKHAHVPKSAKLTYGIDKCTGNKLRFPNISVKNVYIFPGIPDLMQRLFTSVYEEHFGEGNRQFFKKNVYCAEKETIIADYLNTAVAQFPQVTFGSYPKFTHSYYQVHITLEAQCESEVRRAHEALTAMIPQASLINFDSAPLQDAYKKLTQLIEEKGNLNLLTAVKEIDEYCETYKPDEVGIYINNEKESTFTLHLLHACARKENRDIQLQGFRVSHVIPVVPEVEMFITETSLRYAINIKRYQQPMESAVELFLSANPNIKIIIIGCPTSSNTMTDEQMALLEMTQIFPDIIWVNPLLNWQSSEVWEFVRSLYLPYCRINTY